MFAGVCRLFGKAIGPFKTGPYVVPKLATKIPTYAAYTSQKNEGLNHTAAEG